MPTRFSTSTSSKNGSGPGCDLSRRHVHPPATAMRPDRRAPARACRSRSGADLPPVEAELMPGLRADRDYEPFFTMLGQTFGRVAAQDEPWPEIIAVQRNQRELVKIGHHRGPSSIDSLIALTAEHHRLPGLHVDDDFAAVAKVRPGIPMIRLQPHPGSGPPARRQGPSARTRVHRSARSSVRPPAHHGRPSSRIARRGRTNWVTQ